MNAWKERKLVVQDKTYHPLKDVLVLDIETKRINKNKGITPENSKLKIWGAYSYNTGSLHFGYGADFKKLLDSHKIIVGHNIKGFDIPVLQKDLDLYFWDKTIIDTLEVLRKPPSKAEKEAMKKKGKRAIAGKGRANIIGELRQIGMKDDRFPDYKLSTIAKHTHKIFKDHPIYSKFFTEFKDEDFDYSMLEKDVNTKEDWIKIKEYLRRDVVTTKGVFEFLEKYFESLAHYLPPVDISTLSYVHSPTGSYAYKAICHALGLQEEYGESIRETFEGAYVFLPIREKYTPEDGDGYCIDFNSQHPSHIRMMNLCTPAEDCLHKVTGKCPTAHSGDGKIFGLKGTYCACEQGKIEKLITKWYKDRLEYKKNKDPREYTIKILINATYGILSSSVFQNIYNPTTGPDTTLMSKQSTQFMDKWMRKGGYISTYGDTDSLYIMDPYKDKERMIDYINQGVKQITDVLPFSDEHYKMGIDAEFSKIFFFLDDDSKEIKYKKKNYIYITKDNKIKIQGLPILKRNAPRLAKKIYTDHLEEQIKETHDIKFDKDYLRQLIQYEISKDLSVLAIKVRVNPASSYANDSILNAQLSKKYFGGKDGIVTVIKHHRKGYGVGKGKFYCTAEEAKVLGQHEYDLETLWRVLKPFVKEDKQMQLGDY